MIWFCQRVVMALEKVLFDFFLHLKATDQENLPDPKKQYIIIANHRNYMDPFLVCAGFPLKYYFKMRTTRFMAIREFCHFYTLGWFIRPLGAYPVDKGINNTDLALTDTFKIAQKGHNIVIFPEGHRALDGEPKIAKRGIGHLARETKLPIIPVAIRGSLGIKPHLFFLRKKHVSIHFGKPFYYKDTIKESMDDKAAAQIIMNEVNKML